MAVTDGDFAPSSRNLFIKVSSAVGLGAGAYVVRMDAKPKSGTGVSERVALVIPEVTKASFGEALLFRRGPFSGAGWQAAADMQFRRQERIRIEVPTTLEGGSASIRLLGRTGAAVNVPVPVSEGGATSARTIIGELTLAPLAPGDYLIEVSVRQGDGQQKKLVAIRIVP